MKKINLIVLAISVLMLALMILSARKDSAIMDELAHIPAGFGYVVEHDYRLNPEHPPLLKALAAFSAEIFTRPYFHAGTSFWRDEVNGQWSQGDKFLYGSDNDADKIIFWSRLPLMLLTVFLAVLLFYWVEKRRGAATAFLTFLLFIFSPTVLAHGRFVTTDLGATFGFFIGIAALVKFMEKPSRKNVILTGLALGLAQLLKFSLMLLVPIYAIVLFGWSASLPYLNLRERIKVFFRLGIKIALAGALGILLIWGAYYLFGYDTPRGKQFSDAEFVLASNPSKVLAGFDLALIKNNYTRPLGQYFLGVLMVGQRAGGGNTGYFRGEVSASGWRSYFPVLYLYKEPLALHILTLIALVFGFAKIFRGREEKKFSWSARARSWIYGNPAEFSSCVLIGVYWASSMASPLNIGVRHVLPTFPFIYFLVSRQIADWLRVKISSDGSSDFPSLLKNVYRVYIKSVPKYFVVIALMLWMVLGTAAVFPNFLSYYNELAGGAENGYKIAVDSNYDWGQDLLRLRDFVEKNKIDKINLDYFGGGNPKYYLGDKFVPWNSSMGSVSGWYAVSATFRQASFGRPVKGFSRGVGEEYEWLKTFTPVARAGYSIFIYKLP